MADWEEDFNWWGEGEQPAPKTEKSSPLETVSPFDRPQEATSKDRIVAVDELGNNVYETISGKRYTIRPATEEESKTTRAKVEEWIDEGAPLPSWDQIVDTMKSIPGAMYDSAASAVRGEGTVGDALAIVPTSGAAGMATRIGQEFDPNVLSAMGASPRWKPKPGPATKYESREFARDLHNARGNLYDEGLVSDREMYEMSLEDQTLSTELTFEEVEILSQSGDRKDLLNYLTTQSIRNGYDYDFPINSEMMPDLSRATPSQEKLFYEVSQKVDDKLDKYVQKIAATDSYQKYVRAKAEFNELPEQERSRLYNEVWYRDNDPDFEAEAGPTKFRSPLLEVFEQAQFPKDGLKGSAILKEIQDNPDIRVSEFKALGVNIDPQRRYTKDEVLSLIKDYNYDVRASIENKWGTYQRQNDLLDREAGYFEVVLEAERGNKPFKPAKGTHYSDSTVAHGRASLRQNPQGENYVLVEELQSDLLQHGYLKPAEEKELYEVLNNTLSRVSDRENLLFPSKMPTIASNLSSAYQQSMEKAFKGASIEEASELIDDWIKETYNSPENVKFPPAYDPEDPFANDRLVDLEFEPLDDNLPTFEPERSSDFDIRNTVNYYMEDALRDSKGNIPYAIAKGWEIALYDTLQDYDTAKGVGDVLRDTSSKLREITPNVGLPPVLRTEESVTATMDAIIAEAAKRGVTKVVIPPQDKIVEKRFPRDSGSFNKAMDPKSGFTATYNKALNSYIKKLEKEFGDGAVTVNKVPMNYASKPKNFAQSYRATEALSNILHTGTIDPSAEISEQIISRNFEVVDRFIFKRETERDLAWLSNLASDVADSVKDSDRAEDLYHQMLFRLRNTSDGFQGLREVVKEFYKPVEEQVMGVEIDFKGLVDKKYDLSRPRFATGGMVENIDPISGNEVPPGAKPKEVRDDVPIMASEGEYVIPANVVRYIGLDRIEKMVKQAKEGLEELDAEGRIGGEKATMDEDLPFSPEELVAVEEAPSPAPAGMAEGGMVANSEMNIDPATGLPRWLLSLQRQNTPQQAAPPVAETFSAPPQTTQQTSSSDRSQAEKDAMNKPVGLAKPVKDWSVEDYNKYAKFRTSPEASIMKAGANLVPFGGIIANVAQRSTERQVNKNLSEMLSSGKDLNGNPLSTDQLNTLRETYSRVTGEPISRLGGVAGVAKSIAQDAGLIKKPTPTQEQIDRYNERVQGDSLINRAIDFLSGSNKPKAKAPETTTTTSSSTSKTSSAPTKRGESAADRQLGKTPTSSKTGPKKEDVGANNSKTKTTSTTTKSTSSASKKNQAGRAGFAKGGLIKQRNK